MMTQERQKYDREFKQKAVELSIMKQIIVLILLIMLFGCEPDNIEYDIIITDVATNLGELNSEFDDYNSDLPYPHQRMDIYFSSNRNSLGSDFDIVAGKMDFSYHSEDDILNVSIPMAVN
ncbi:MAG: hypothetical protein KAR19_15735 [Bacteroidales bacterium]|nr:hypothetical protein [Bacteroidales bacterium]